MATTTVTFKMDENLKKDFKRVCLEKDVTQAEIINKLVEEYVEKNKDKK
ncbi:MAG: hypothetical protein ACLTQH_03375 [Fusobacterium sp.]|nr:hypothetical protein [uncultured Fusobacterium sp.]